MAVDDLDMPVLVERPKKLAEMSIVELDEYQALLSEEIERVKSTITKKKAALLDAAKIFG